MEIPTVKRHADTMLYIRQRIMIMRKMKLSKRLIGKILGLNHQIVANIETRIKSRNGICVDYR